MGFKREDIRDTSPLSLKKLNDTLRHLWLHSFGNITFTDLSPKFQTRITKTEAEITQMVSRTTYEAGISTLQNQIDGVQYSWFYAYAPTLSNEPAISWNTDILKNDHIGDTFTDTTVDGNGNSTGYSYRFINDNGTYKWAKITDTEATQALLAASKAQDTADNKRRVFVTTPYVPYDVGDLWVQGVTGDIYKCKVAKLATDTYNVADWEKASKYTDDAYAKAVETNLGTRITNAETNISQNAGQIMLKADLTVTNSLGQRISDAESQLIIQAGEISSKVNNIDYESYVSTNNSQVNKALADAATAQETAEAADAAAYIASSDATTANTLLAELSNDNKMTPVEKQMAKKEWDIIVSEKPTISTQAENYELTDEKIAYWMAYDSLSSYVPPLFADLTVVSDVDGEEFRQIFKNYYDKKTLLLKAVADKAKVLATTAQLTADDALDAANIAQETAYNATTRIATAEQLITSEAITNTVTQSTTYKNDINGIKGRLDSAELKITSSAIVSTVRSSTEYTNDLGEKINSSQASSIAQTPSNIQIGFNGINDVIDIDSSGLQVNHSDGSYTRMESAGIKRYVAGTGKSYHYLIETGRCITIGDGVTPIWVQLPDEFKNKNFKVTAHIEDSYNGGTTKRVIQKFNTYIYGYDYTNAKVGIIGYRNELDTLTGNITIDSLGINWTAIV